MRQGLADWFDSETGTSEELQTAEARLTKLRTMEKNLQQLYLEEDISHNDFKEHRARIEAERSRLTNTVAAVQQRQNLVKADFEIALQLATELDYLYDKGNFDERRLLCETVLKRLYVEEGTVKKVELNSPFALIASRAKSSESVINGGAEETRTPDFLLAKEALSRLSYSPVAVGYYTTAAAGLLSLATAG